MMKNKAYSYIRFSTPEQRKGDSLRRQIKGAEAWAKKHGVELDNTLKPDEGFSAFNGHHRTKGALGEFLRLVESSKIPKGSILIVESLDRLSREQVLDALGQFTQIISRGIKVVTLSDGMEYSEESINANFGQLLMSIVIMSRAHEESATKSKRLKEAWETKRKNIQKEKLTKRCPAWLKLSEDRTEYKPIDIREQTIRDIFRMKLDGKGATAIERELNGMDGIWQPKKKGKKSGWRTSYIKKILRNSAVIGEFQPHKMVDGKRQPAGDPIKDYFPGVVDPKDYYAVQDQMKKNAKDFHGGRTGKLNNLFSHMAVCGYCGSPMH
jgi:DNA invertase Pin-like site-specific DNA recombinase